MQLTIKYQEDYSRGQLVLRAFLGRLMQLPHLVVLRLIGIWAGIIGYLCKWVTLFTGQYPEKWFQFQVNFIRWETRQAAYFSYLFDGYPKFGLECEDDSVAVNVPYTAEVTNRGDLWLRFLFGFIYITIPHAFCLMFRQLAHMFVRLLAFWIIFFSGKLPENWHGFMVGTYRWKIRVRLYSKFIIHEYPRFSGKS